MNNTAKKWYINCWGFFSAILSLLVLCFILNIGEAKASTINVLPQASAVTIPSYTGGAVIYCITQIASGHVLSLNGVSFTDSRRDDGGGFDWTYSYIKNPAIGTWSWGSGDSDYIGPPQCYFIDGLDADFPITTTTSINTGWTYSNSFDYVNAVSGNPVILGARLNSEHSSSGANPALDMSIIGWRGSMYDSSWLATGPEIKNFNTGASLGGTIQWYGQFIEFNAVPDVPATMDYVQYNYSQGPAEINGAGNPVNWSIHYNVCDTGFPVTGGYLKLNVQDTTKFYDIGTVQNIISNSDGTAPCQGDMIYTGYVDNSAYGTSTMFLKLNTVDNEDNVTQTIYSSGFTVTQYPEIIYSNGNIHYFGPNPLITNTASSTGAVDIPFTYNICNQDEYASSTFVLENLDTNTLTDIATSTPVACSGEGHLSLNYGTSTVLSLNARVDLVSATSSRQILGNSFNIILQTSDAGIVKNTKSCNIPKFDETITCPDLTASTSTSIFTIPFFTCAVGRATFWVTTWAFYPNCGSLYYVTDTFDKFKKVFPFNAYFDFIGTIDTAINTSLTSTTTTQTIDIPFIRQTSTSSEYYMLPVMTTSSIPNIIGVTNYGTFRTTLGYIYWVVIGLLIFLMIKK